MTSKDMRDISGDIGPLPGLTAACEKLFPIKYAMYSFASPAYILWTGVFNGLLENGFSEEEAFEWLQSKDARWAFDGNLGTQLEKLGFEYGLSMDKK